METIQKQNLWVTLRRPGRESWAALYPLKRRRKVEVKTFNTLCLIPCTGIKCSGDPPLLHGRLHIEAVEARDLPDTDNAFFNISRGDLTDPYLEIALGPSSVVKTSVKWNCLNPVWNEKFTVDVCNPCHEVRIKVKDREHIGEETVGYFDVPVTTLLRGEEVGGWFDLIVGKNGKTKGQVNINIKYIPVTETLSQLEGTYFPMTSGNSVTLYQDADTPQLEIFRGVTESDGTQYQATRCWADLYTALSGAEKLIYITGWSVHTGIRLVRGPQAGPGQEETVGEVLKRKAVEGVRVLVMTWNDRSNDGGLLDGMMGTHDEETLEYFAGSGVICANVPRTKKSWLGLGGTFVSTCYTHHQKTIIVDAPRGSGDSDPRRLVAFLGGLDITDGRYDSPEFPLFSTLRTLHEGDFYQNCTPGASSESGPRQPWHDIHARLEGPAASHILQNFMERWTNQNPDQTSSLLGLEKLDLEAPGEGGWSVRILRSITSDSAELDLNRELYLHKKYGHMIDNSIERSYVRQIRSAQQFIYIENQYFLGSAFSWLKERDTLTHHIIPMELTQKIISKIYAGEEFRVYICIPMYPEGDPSTAASQEILYWQHCTMEAMYKKIAEALRESGAGGHPQDYLNFYCLGKRESPDDVPDYLDTPQPDSSAETVRRTLRHPIYVHSKLMIVDDRDIILGSANINQRSLGGNRDSEICLEAHQPLTPSTGGVHSFRLALWSAHIGGYRDSIREPGSSHCLEDIARIAADNWSSYISPTPQASKVHLLPYPVKVETTGDVVALPAPHNNFPDTSASVLGTKSGFLPVKLTT